MHCGAVRSISHPLQPQSCHASLRRFCARRNSRPVITGPWKLRKSWDTLPLKRKGPGNKPGPKKYCGNLSF